MHPTNKPVSAEQSATLAELCHYGDRVCRFLKHVSFLPGGCWVWRGSLADSGYGKASMADGGWEGAHRESYRLFVGPIPDGLWVLHKCDNRPCVNPAHLFTGTTMDNFRDCQSKGRHAHGERHGRRVLTSEQVLMIRSVNETGKSLATRLGVCRATISMIRNRKIWKHL